MELTYRRVLDRILKHESKTKKIFVRTCFGWEIALACKAKTPTGVKYRRMARLIVKLRKSKGLNHV